MADSFESYRVPDGTKIIVTSREGAPPRSFKIVQEVDGKIIHETLDIVSHTEPRETTAIGLLLAGYLGMPVSVKA